MVRRRRFTNYYRFEHDVFGELLGVSVQCEGELVRGLKGFTVAVAQHRSLGLEHGNGSECGEYGGGGGGVELSNVYYPRKTFTAQQRLLPTRLGITKNVYNQRR